MLFKEKKPSEFQMGEKETAHTTMEHNSIQQVTNSRSDKN